MQNRIKMRINKYTTNKMLRRFFWSSIVSQREGQILTIKLKALWK